MNTHAVAVNRVAWVAACAALAMSVGAVAQPSDAALDAVVRKMADYVAAYGERASVIVAAETYTQLHRGAAHEIPRDAYGRPRPTRVLTSEFAIVKVADQLGWTGFRDVVEVDGQQVADRQDRLVTLLTGPVGGDAELRRLANESARYNIGAVIRNVNLPTTAMFFFHPQHVGRFSFRRTGTMKIDGVETWAIDFTEIRTPTLVMKRDGTDVPAEGTLWVVPGDGTIVRTRLRLQGFAELVTASSATAATSVRGSQSMAEIDVNYRRDPASGVWFPDRMEDVYRVPARVPRGDLKYVHTMGRATYSNLRYFQTAVRIVVPQ